MRKAEANAKKFYYLKALTSWITPAQTSTTPLTGTPYQFYIDQYKKLQQSDPKSADDEFLKKYGEDYFVFSTSLSKSMGIAPYPLRAQHREEVQGSDCRRPNPGSLHRWRHLQQG